MGRNNIKIHGFDPKESIGPFGLDLKCRESWVESWGHLQIQDPDVNEVKFPPLQNPTSNLLVIIS